MPTIGVNETSIIVDEPPGSTVKANKPDANDAKLLERLNIAITQCGSSFNVDPSNVDDSWNCLSDTDGARVYSSNFLLPVALEELNTTQSAANESKNMTGLILAEKNRISSLADLYEELNKLKAKSSAQHGPRSTAARQETLARLQLEYKIERENANLLLVKRKAQASLLESDVILKNSIDAVNGKKTSVRSLETFPEYLK